MNILKRFRFSVFHLLLGFAFLFLAQPVLAQDEIQSWEALRSRPYPQWFKDAKLGVFIHWGIYSVPSYGAAEAYGEWYLRGLQVGTQNRLEFMKKNWGEDFEYNDFAPLFKAELFDADEWASIFKSAGAKYIILVSKHHDGYCLWPSKYAPGWNSVDVGPKRNILEELSQAVKKQDIRFGLYYSLPEWNNALHKWDNDPHDSIHTYVEDYMIPQFKELITTFKPDLLFADGDWTHSAEDWHTQELISFYYNTVGADAIVNDRWGHGADIGYITPEYSAGGLKTDRPWAEVRGLGRSFGLNRNEKLEAYMTSEELIRFFIRTVANGGGITINVGPAADGKIPLLQEERLKDIGKWIDINEEAIYGSTAWTKSAEEREISFERIDPNIDFDWVRNSPVPGISEDNFKAVWTGFLKAPATETFNLSAKADDGVRLYIDDQLVLDQWEQQEEAEVKKKKAKKNTFKMKKDVLYPVRVEYHEELLQASIQLYWSSKSMEEQIIASDFFFTENSTDAPQGLKGVYSSMKQTVAYTHNHGNLYATCLEWPGETLQLPIPKPAEGTKISLLGRDGNLNWRYDNNQLIIDLNEIRYAEIPHHAAWTFKIENYK